MSIRGLAAGIFCAFLATPATATECPTGMFRADAGPDTASMLEIGEDGHFRYMLAEGALDEEAQGNWTCADGTLKLTTAPTPKPSEFKLASTETGGEAPFELHVTWPDGRGIAGIDFRLEFDSGEPETSYTQNYGWTLEETGGRTPTQIQLAEPYHGSISPIFPIPTGRGIVMTVVLVPNDLGTATFHDTPVTQRDGKLLLHWRGGELPYVPAKR